MGFRAKISKHKALDDLIGSGGLHAAGFFVPKAGFYLTTWGYGRQIGQAATEGRVYFTPIHIPDTVTFDRIACQVALGSAAGGVVRMGVYRNDLTTQYPGERIGDYGTVAVTAGGIKTIDIVPSLTLGEGLYWLASAHQGAPATQATFIGSDCQNGTEDFWNPNPFFPIVASSTLTGGMAGVVQDGVAGALPNPAVPAGLSRIATLVGLRKA